jgi:hypothetical protein
MTVTWKITHTEYIVETGFIVRAHWSVSAVDGNYSAFLYGTCGFPESALNDPYAELNEEMVLNWCWSNNVDREAIENQLNAQIKAQKTPVTATGVPW